MEVEGLGREITTQSFAEFSLSKIQHTQAKPLAQRLARSRHSIHVSL